MLFNLSVKLVGGQPPVKREGDAGYDLFASEDTVIAPGAIGLIPLGIQSSFDSVMVGLIKDRSSYACKGLHIFAGVIDSTYRGEWKVVMFNSTSDDVIIAAGDKCAQVIFTICSSAPVVVVDELPDSVRGIGGFGSTGQ